MPERDHAPRTHREVKACCEEGHDRDLDREHQGEVFRERGEREERRKERQPRRPEAGRGRSEGRLRGADLSVLPWCLRPAEQSPRAEDEDHRHHHEHEHQGALGDDEDPERAELRDEHRGEEGARDAPHASHHHHHEHRGEDVEVHEEVGAPLRELGGAAEPRQHRAEKEGAGEEPRLVDPECADHLPVLGRGPDEGAPAGTVEEQPQGAEHEEAQHDEGEVVLREPGAEDVHRAFEPRRGGAEEVLRPPHEEGEVLDDEDDPEGRDELEELRGLVHPAEDEELDHDPDDPDPDPREEDRHPEAERAGEVLDEGVRDVRPQHVERAVREIDDPGHPEDDGEPRGDQEQGRRAREAGQRLDEVEPEVTHRPGPRRAFDPGGAAWGGLATIRSLPCACICCEMSLPPSRFPAEHLDDLGHDLQQPSSCAGRHDRFEVGVGRVECNPRMLPGVSSAGCFALMAFVGKSGAALQLHRGPGHLHVPAAAPRLRAMIPRCAGDGGRPRRPVEGADTQGRRPTGSAAVR